MPTIERPQVLCHTPYFARVPQSRIDACQSPIALAGCLMALRRSPHSYSVGNGDFDATQEGQT
jgi:hypothetical protein